MVRLLTCALVVLVVVIGACGGGGGHHAALQALFPSDDPPVGTLYSVDNTKTVIRTTVVGTKIRNSTFEIDRLVDPVGPDLTFVGFQGDPDFGAGFEWTSRGLEVTAIFQTTFWGVDGVTVTATSPGLLVLPASLEPGQTYDADIVGSPLTNLHVTWVGGQSVPGHSHAQRFDFLGTGPYSMPDPLNPRFGATSVKLFGSIFLVEDVGPVSGVIHQQFVNGPTVVEERRYDFTLVSVTPGP